MNEDHNEGVRLPGVEFRRGLVATPHCTHDLVVNTKKRSLIHHLLKTRSVTIQSDLIVTVGHISELDIPAEIIPSSSKSIARSANED